MKLATFNINNVNKRLSNLVRWLKQSKPDVVCLQELKCEASDFPETALRKAGYSAGGACPASLLITKPDTSRPQLKAW